MLVYGDTVSVYLNSIVIAIHLEILESTARITEARLNREQSEGKIIHYQRLQDLGYRVITSDAITCKEAKVSSVCVRACVCACMCVCVCVCVCVCTC